MTEMLFQKGSHLHLYVGKATDVNKHRSVSRSLCAKVAHCVCQDECVQRTVEGGWQLTYDKTGLVAVWKDCFSILDAAETRVSPLSSKNLNGSNVVRWWIQGVYVVPREEVVAEHLGFGLWVNKDICEGGGRETHVR